MTQRKLTVGILCGGKSAEHEVSLQSAKNIFHALDRQKYEPVLIGIDKTGRWFLPQGEGESVEKFLHAPDDPARIALNQGGDPVALAPAGGGVPFSLGSGLQGKPLDVVFPVLHGPFGEDGTVQGLLKLAGIPFVGAGVLGSAVGMDKDVMKRLLRDAGIPVGRFRAFRSGSAPAFDDLAAELGLPLFVKPANMGSSVGVSKVRTRPEYDAALREAFTYDTKVIAEEFIPGRELECAVLGDEPPEASLPGEVIAAHEFYSYQAKYLDEKGAVLEIPAKRLAPDRVRQIQDLALRTFNALECEGLGRVDLFLREDGRLLVNEINTMPGFTRISMYPKLWEAGGLSYSALLDRLIEAALRRFAREQRLQTFLHI